MLLSCKRQSNQERQCFILRIWRLGRAMVRSKWSIRCWRRKQAHKRRMPIFSAACAMHIKYLHIRRKSVRIHIDIDDRLMRRAMRWRWATTKKAAVQAGLRLLAETHAQGSIRRLRGKVRWEGNLDRSRLGRARRLGNGHWRHDRGD